MNSLRSSMNAAFWLVWNDTWWQTSLLWQIASKVVLLFVAFLGFLDCEQSLSSPYFSEKKKGRLLAVCRFFNRFNFLMWLGWLRLVSDCSVVFFFWNINHVCSSYCTLVLVRGSFQASLLGISVMTGNVTFYLTMQWALSCSHFTLSLVICYCGKTVSLVPGYRCLQYIM